MTTSKLAEIVNEEYQASGASVETDETLDEMIAEKLSDNQIEVDEDSDPTPGQIAYVTELVRSAVQEWVYAESVEVSQ